MTAQDPEIPDVLVLSLFGSAAAQLREAVIVNPPRRSPTAWPALAMPRNERVRRWEAMIDNVRREDVLWRRNRFLQTSEGASAAP